MRLRVRQVGRVHELVEESAQPVRGQIGVVPGRSPPGIREKAQAVAALAQGRERVTRVREHGAPARDRARVAVKRGDQRAIVDIPIEPPEAVAHESGGRAAPVVAIDALPVRLFRGAHRGDELLSRRPDVPHFAHRVVREAPLLGRATLPIRPLHKRAAEVEDDRPRRGHARSGMRDLTPARRISRPMRSETRAMSGASARSVSSFGTGSRTDRRASSTPGAVVAPRRSRPCAPQSASIASASRVFRTTAASLSAAWTPLIPRTSTPADVGTASADGGTARSRFSVTSAALVYCATMKPEFVPAAGLRNGGRALVCAFVSRSSGASAGAAHYTPRE